MSFKRDGDDSSLLNLLRKRRIDELFTANIPKGEALLTSNGRFACLICPNKPVFDTVNVLAVHRNGKKHLAAQNYIGNQPQTRKKNPIKSFLSKPTYDQRISNRNESKTKPQCEDFETLRDNLERINKDMEERLITLKPYESKCNISSSYTLHQATYELNLQGNSVINDLLSPETNKEKTQVESKDVLQSFVQESDKSQRDKLGKWTNEQKELFINKLESGWKKTANGFWVKDEGVEFDSDEEPPCF